jgi:NRAMP (natural resistance-associated macrophage protein)-like metal ion transporter
MNDFHVVGAVAERSAAAAQAIGAGRPKNSRMSPAAKSYYAYRRCVKALRLFCAIAGPGIIVMVADNDAGGITTYTTTGAKYGLYLLWFLVLLGPVAYYVQEMTVRLGAVTKRGHAEAIFSAFGRFWGWFSLLDLVLTDWLTMITEFIGMTAAMSIFGLPPWLTVLGCWLIMGGMILSGRYWTWEKITLIFCVGNLIYIPAAFMIQPSVRDIFRYTFIPTLPPGGFTNDLFFMLMANIGTTIAPWMLFFQQSSVVDKGLKEKDIKFGKVDTAIGAFLTVVVAMVLIIVCGTLLNGQKIEDAAIAARVIMPQSKFIGTVMAIGLFDAGLLGAVCISLASSWAFGEVFGWAHSLNQKIKEAPWFYAYYFFDLLLAGTVVLIPNAPLVLITMFVQVIATTLLPAALVFLILLLNDKKTMGGYVNSLWENIANISIVVGIIVMSTLYGISALFPEAFSDPRGAWNDTGAYLLNLHWTPANMTLAILAAVAVGVAAGMWWSGRRLPLDVLERWFLYRICGSAGRTIGALAVTGATVTWDLYRIKAVLPDLLSHPRQAWNETIAGFQGLGWTPANVALAVLVAVLAAALVGVFMGRSWLAHLGRGMAAFLARSRFARFFRLTRGQVREVNRRYARPEIETTLLAKTCLVGLRVYLVLLVVLMVFKFITAALQG